jgi:hypothetical protein
MIDKPADQPKPNPEEGKPPPQPKPEDVKVPPGQPATVVIPPG